MVLTRAGSAAERRKLDRLSVMVKRERMTDLSNLQRRRAAALDSQTRSRVLIALFVMSRDNRPISAASLARAAALTPTRAAEALIALERAGLVDATRARLTMLGLATAVRCGGAGAGGAAVAAALARCAEQPSGETAAPWAASVTRQSSGAADAEGESVAVHPLALALHAQS